MVLAPRPIPLLVEISHSWPPTCSPTDKPDNFYPIPAPGTFLSGNCGSSTRHIGKYVIEVLEAFANSTLNPRQPSLLHFSQSTFWAIHWDIVNKYFPDASQLIV